MMSLPSTSLPFILYFVKKQWTKFIIFIIAAVMLGLNDAFFPFWLKHIINILQFYQTDPSKIYHSLGPILLWLVLFWGLSEFFIRLEGITEIYTFPRFRAEIRSKIFQYVKGHSQEYFANQFAGNIAKKIADLPNSCQTLIEITCFQFITFSTVAISIFILMWLTKPLFAIFLLIWLTIHMGFIALFLRYSNQLWETHSEAVSELNGNIVDTLVNIFTVRSFARNTHEQIYLQKYQSAEIAKAKKAMWAVELMRIGMGLNGLFLIFGMILLLIYSWSHEWITLGDFTQIMMQSFWLLGCLWFLSFQVRTFLRERGTINNALKLAQKQHDILDQPHAKPIMINKGEIEYRNVNFSYRSEDWVFKNFNVKIPSAQKVGLVGFSGSGKSSFINLLLRLYDIQGGQILIDQQEIATVTQESLRQQIALIPQDPTLFHRTLMENIRYGRLAATDTEVIAAAKLAHCHEFISVLDEGYQALVGERGIKLSGGQRQRIAIARAILKNAPILILDEATSSLDSVTEKLIQESLQQLMQNKTTIVVAHRLSTLNNMDRILVFHQGRIIEDGTQAELLQAKGHFAMLWQKQSHGFLPENAQ